MNIYMKTILLLISILLFNCNMKKADINKQNVPELLQEKIEIINEEVEIVTINPDDDNKIYKKNNEFSLNTFYADEKLDIVLNFDIKNNKYNMESGGPDWSTIVNGIFVIDNGKVYLTPTDINMEKNFEWIQPDLLNKIKEEWELYFIEIENNIDYTKALTGKNIIFYDMKSPPDEEEIRIVDGIEMITMEIRQYRLKENASVRVGPGMQYEPFLIWGRDYLSAGKEMIINGHSTNIDTLNGLTGYWYYGIMGLYFDDEVINPNGGDSRYGWIFSPLLELMKKNY